MLQQHTLLPEAVLSCLKEAQAPVNVNMYACMYARYLVKCPVNTKGPPVHFKRSVKYCSQALSLISAASSEGEQDVTPAHPSSASAKLSVYQSIWE